MKSEFKAKLIQHLLNRKNSEKGFTLIELLVVVIIIGILAAIALPTFLGQVNKARHAEARNFVATAGKLQQTTFLENNSFALSFTGDAAGKEIALLAEGGLDTALRFYDATMSAVNPTSGIEFVSAINAQPKRTVLKAYFNGIWAAQLPGATVPEIFTRVCEQAKAGVGGAAATNANIIAASDTNSAAFKCAEVGGFIDLGK